MNHGHLPCCQQVLSADDAANHAAASLSITLDGTDRHRRRRRLIADQGVVFMLDLPVAHQLRHGDALCLDDGRQVLVQALPEPLYEVHARDSSHLVSLAWQLGNRHLPAQILPDRIRIRRDPVIRAMLHELGAALREVSEPFDPLGGAYASKHAGTAHAHQYTQDRSMKYPRLAIRETENA